jgi:rhomboid protease GluP
VLIGLGEPRNAPLTVRVLIELSGDMIADPQTYEPPLGYEVVLRTRQRKECFEARLVLDSAGIATESVHQDGWWCLIVSRSDAALAQSELEAYRRENPEPPSNVGTDAAIYGGAETAIFFYAGVLLLFAVLTAREAFGPALLAAGQMQAGSVMAGQWWRVVTALTLHLDAGHIASNLIFGAVFGLMAGRVLGGGVAWLAIVAAGAVGNWINAAVQPPTHNSIGASTAVFAALGMLVAHALRPRLPVQEKAIRRWSPLIGGVLLLAITGVGGERTDVAAHFTGFLAGMAIGWIGSRLPADWLANRRLQYVAGASALAIVTICWLLAITTMR